MNYQIRIQLKGQLQIFYTRAMKKEFKNIVELCLGKLDKVWLRYIYTSWLGDNSASENLSTKEIDEQVKIMVELEDSNIITDLRGINEDESRKYDIFWEYTNKYLEGKAQESVLVVDERWHDSIQYLAKCNISVHDLRQEVIKLCLENTNIPSI